MSHPWDQKWEVIERLAVGGQGVTHLVQSLGGEGGKGVLKYLKNNRDSPSRMRMRREVANLQILAALGARVPRVLDSNVEKAEDTSFELYLVMEFIDGLTLKQIVEQKGRLSVGEATQLAMSLCEVVKVSHAEEIVHRDIKPDNIVIPGPETNDVFIVDYGLSFNSTDADLTRADETIRNRFLDLPETNTPGSNRRDPRSDVTAVCATYYFMLTGHYPGQLQDASGKLPHLRPGYTVREAISDDARQSQIELVLSRGFNPTISKRYQSIEELSERLVQIHKGSMSMARPNPIATAAEMSAHLRAQDRKTQLMEFEPAASSLLREFKHRVKEIGKELERFKVGMREVGDSGPSLDRGLDGVTQTFLVQLNVDHHNVMRQRNYRVASRDEQCMVVACDAPPRPSDGGEAEAVWQEIVWYEGKPDEVLGKLILEFKEWLDQRLQEITAEIVSI